MNTALPVDFFHDERMGVSETNCWARRIRIVIAITMAAILTGLVTGCAGYVDDGSLLSG